MTLSPVLVAAPRPSVPGRALISWFAALGATVAGHAQSAPEATAVADDENVVGVLTPFVTVGTRFAERTVTESSVPIDILPERELRHGGYTETAKIPQAQIPSFNNPHPTTPDGHTHIRSATLRGLSPDQTLVLVNGKRRHTSAWVNTGGTIGRDAVSTELNAIPSTALGRVEVLRDGASAQYGSEAIAGVIHLVLREDVGASFTGTFGTTREGDGDDGDRFLRALFVPAVSTAVRAIPRSGGAISFPAPMNLFDDVLVAPPMSSENLPSGSPSAKPAPHVPPVWLHTVRRNIESLAYGVVQVVVHDGRVREIDVTEKTRVTAPRTRPSPGADHDAIKSLGEST